MRSTRRRASALRTPILSRCWRRCAARWRQRWAGRSSISAGLPLSALLCRAALRRCCAGCLLRGLPPLWRARLCLRPARFYWSARSGTPRSARSGLCWRRCTVIFVVPPTEPVCVVRGLFVINILAVGIHPYFLPMTYAVTLALLLEYAVTHRRQWAAARAVFGRQHGSAPRRWAGRWGCLYGTATSGGQALYGYFCHEPERAVEPGRV